MGMGNGNSWHLQLNVQCRSTAARQSIVSPPCGAGMQAYCAMIGCILDTHQQRPANLPPVHTGQPSKGCPHSAQHHSAKGCVRNGQYPVGLMASPQFLSHSLLPSSTRERVGIPGGCPCVIDGTIDDAGGVWVHYSKTGMPLLRSGSCGLIRGLRPAN